MTETPFELAPDGDNPRGAVMLSQGFVTTDVPIPFPLFPPKPQSRPPASASTLRWMDYPGGYTWADHPSGLTWGELDTIDDLGSA